MQLQTTFDANFVTLLWLKTRLVSMATIPSILALQVIFDINVRIAVFRDLLIHVGTLKDCTELREKIRRVRRQCVEACKHTNAQLLPHIKRYIPFLLSCGQR
jgi:hypothetical protein